MTPLNSSHAVLITWIKTTANLAKDSKVNVFGYVKRILNYLPPSPTLPDLFLWYSMSMATCCESNEKEHFKTVEN